MFLRDFITAGFKIFRDPSVDNDRKADQGVEVTAHSEVTGDFETQNPGDEQGWLYSPESSGARNGLGAWSQIVPALKKNSDGKIYAILDKTLSVDTNFAAKTISGTSGDSSTSCAEAEETSTGMPGLLATCLRGDQQEQIFFPIASESSKFARVAWNFNVEQDLSEGEIVSADGLYKFLGTGDLVWISWEHSDCQFLTAGDYAIFEIRKIGTATRKGKTRDLYRCISCYYDGGSVVKYLVSAVSAPNHRIDGSIGRDGLSWSDLQEGKIKTTIGSQSKVNMISCRIPDEWEHVLSTTFYTAVEIYLFDRGMPFLCRPIRPILDDRTNKIYTSAILVNNKTIAKYKKA